MKTNRRWVGVLLPREMLEGSSSNGQWNTDPRSGIDPASPDALAERIWRREMNVLRSVTRRFKTSQFGPIRRYEWTIRVRRREDVVTLHDCIQWLLQESVVAECPHEDLMAEAEEEGFSNHRVVNRHFQLNTQASTSPNMPPKAFENPEDLAQAAKDYGRDTQREQMSYISQTGSAGQQACLREEGLSTSNINKAFLDAAKDILKNN
ncbi:hypothetical protein PROFUN_04859 [Planoprotostelium fungivorum]|uniref:Uncharacterized protein n=1 Tax=Planoprotostelium fungivorum TaxID=1890364 RepID=A0A2P6NF14_9EUKA|nr:hypothetical protein PROFUN_04859 [Planoprotostelium fungivorum]